MDPYDEAVETAATADKAIRWSWRARAFGEVLLLISALVLIAGVVTIVAGVSDTNGPVIFGGAALILYSISGFVIGSVVITLALYVLMKSQEVNYRVSHLLSGDEN